MTESNVEIVKLGFEPLEAGDVDALMPFVHPDFEMTTPSHLASEPDTYTGRDGVRDRFVDLREELEPDRLLARSSQSRAARCATSSA